MVQLTQKERRLGIGAIAVAAVWCLYGFVVEPMRDRIHTLQRVIPEKQSELQAVEALSAEYVALRQEIEDVQTHVAEQDSDFQLLPFLEVLIEQQQLTSYVVTMDRDTLSSQPGYSETVVEIGLEGISLRQLIHFLKAVETSEVLAKVGVLSICRRAEDRRQLNSTIQIHCPRPSPNVLAAGRARS